MTAPFADAHVHGPDCIHGAPPADADPNIVAAMFAWWNRAFADHALTAEGFADFFTDDAVFLIDGTVRARGPEELAAYFGAIRAAADTVTLHPPEDHFASADRVFVHYRTSVRAGDHREEHDIMGAARIVFGRIAFFKAVRRIV